MTLDEFRHRMESFRREVDEEAMQLKDSYRAIERLHALYKSLDHQERAMADRVLAEWALSDDENLRFDALALIDDFRIAAALPALQELAVRLSESRVPGAPYELRKVARIVEGLSPNSQVP